LCVCAGNEIVGLAVLGVVLPAIAVAVAAADRNGAPDSVNFDTFDEVVF
jgi:hypothetical protein